MKTLEQIKKYTSSCKFSPEDWSLVTDYCRNYFDGKKTNKCVYPISNSTYDQFVQWVDNGAGSGDVVRYGHSIGVVSVSTPDVTILAAYLDHNGDLVIDKMKVATDKVFLAAASESDEFMNLLYDAGYDFFGGALIEVYEPKPDTYVTGKILGVNGTFSALFHGFEGDMCVFSALYSYGRIKFNERVERKYVRFYPAGTPTIKAIQNAALEEGYVLNSRAGVFVKRSEVRRTNKYWYISERFTVLSDIDNGGKKHKDRFDAGNYFLDETEAFIFAKRIGEMRSEEMGSNVVRQV